jgi:2-oxoglutarate ferredoxin oxidoreductase subunit beta
VGDLKKVFGKPESLSSKPNMYCPGCGHGLAHRLTAEAIDVLGLKDRCVGVASVGCSVFADEYFDFDFIQAAHGRAPAVATGLKRTKPDCIVFTHQGDGDLASIGAAEMVHSANRGEKITIIFVNNAIYGMTGGQMAPTTLPGQVTTSSPRGRDVETAGFPMKVAELLAVLPGVGYVTRQSVLDVPSIRRTKRAIKLAFQVQLAGLGFSMVEVLSTCGTNWHLGPLEALEWAKEHMVAYFPLGDTKMSDAVKALKEGK